MSQEEQDFAEEKASLMSMCAEVGAHLMDYPNPSPSEKELLKTIDFLLRALMSVVDRVK